MPTPATHGTGLVRQPADRRDLHLASVLPGAAAPPPASVDLARYVHRVEDQGSTNRCQSFATLKGMEMQRAKQGLPYLDPSFDWTYFWARKIDSVIAGQHGAFSGDDGATLRSAMKSLATSGLCQVTHHRKDGLYDGWPNAKATMNIDPEQWWQQNRFVSVKRVGGLYECDFDPQLAAHHHLDLTYRAVSPDVASFRAAIAAGFAVAFGIPARASLYGVQQDGIMFIPTDAEQSYGYHAITALGYDDHMVAYGHTGHFKILNSWGTGFGMGGYGWLPYDFFTQTTPDNRPFDAWSTHASA